MLGTACAASPRQPEKIFEDVGTIHVVSSSSGTYWLAVNPFSSPTPSGDIYRATADGALLIVGGLSSPQALAVGAGSVYWSNTESGTLWTAAADGSSWSPSLLASDAAAAFATVDDSFVYWTNFSAVDTAHGTIRRVPTMGGSVELLGSELESPSMIAVDDSAIFWMTAWGHAVFTMSRTGNQPLQLMSLGTCGPWGMAIDERYAYAICHGFDGTAPASSIVRVSKTGGEMTAFAASRSYPNYITTFASNVYWTEYDSLDGGKGSIIQASTDGQQDVLATTSGSNVPDSLAVDEDYIYWTTSNDEAVSEVWRLARTR